MCLPLTLLGLHVSSVNKTKQQRFIDKFMPIALELYKIIIFDVKENIEGTSLRSGRVTHLKSFFSKTYIFLLPTYLVYQSLFCGTLICFRSGN